MAKVGTREQIEGLNEDFNLMNVKIALCKRFTSEQHDNILQEIKSDVLATQRKLVSYIEQEWYNEKENNNG